jgi:hypothetical protein
MESRFNPLGIRVWAANVPRTTALGIEQELARPVELSIGRYRAPLYKKKYKFWTDVVVATPSTESE